MKYFCEWVDLGLLLICNMAELTEYGSTQQQSMFNIFARLLFIYVAYIGMSAFQVLHCLIEVPVEWSLDLLTS